MFEVVLTHGFSIPTQEQEQDEDTARRPQPFAGGDAALSSSPVTAAARARVRAAMRRPLTPFVLTTEVIEPGVPIAPAEQEGLIEALCAYTQSRSRQGQGLAALTVMGSLPTGVAPAYYAKVRTNEEGLETRTLGGHSFAYLAFLTLTSSYINTCHDVYYTYT